MVCLEMFYFGNGFIPKSWLHNAVVQVDDLIATGGTMGAGLKLMEKVQATVVECASVIELPDLKGRDKLGNTPLYVLVEKEGEWE